MQRITFKSGSITFRMFLTLKAVIPALTLALVMSLAPLSSAQAIECAHPFQLIQGERVLIHDRKWSNKMRWDVNSVRMNEDGVTTLTLQKSEGEVGGTPYKSGAFRTKSVAKEGTWSWVAKAPKMVDGAVFGMFLYRARHVKDPWLEFDIEFVGGNTNKVQLSVHMEKPDGTHITNFGRRVIDLGFDASEDFHVYEISVERHRTIFRIDSVDVWEFTSADMPDGIWLNGNMRSITSLWVAQDKLKSWTGKWTDPGRPLVAEIKKIGTPFSPVHCW